MPSIYEFCATISKVTVYDDNGKPRTRILQWSPVAGLIGVIFIDTVTCAMIVYWFLATIYMHSIRAYLALIFTNMGNAATFAETFVIAYTATTCMFTAVLLRVLMPIYGPGGNPSAGALTMVESAWARFSSAN